MGTGELTKQELEAYVKEQGFFPQDAPLRVTDLGEESSQGESFVNLVYRVEDVRSGKSLIAKQITPYMIIWKRRTGEEHPVAVSRLENEVRFMLLARQVFGEVAPEVYRLDRGLRLILMEDVGHLDVLRFKLAEGAQFPEFGLTMGGFLAGLRFFTSTPFLSPEAKAKGQRLFDCGDTKQGMLDFYFSDKCALFDTGRPYQPEARRVQRRIIANETLRKRVQALGRKIGDQDCVCHWDLTAGNIMVGEGEIRVIDCEFSGYGPAFVDPAKLVSSFLLNHVSWLGVPDVPREARLAAQGYALQMIRDVFFGYRETLKNLFALHQDHVPQLKWLDPERAYRGIFHDALRCAVLTAALRVPGDGGTVCDIARIQPGPDLELVQRRFLEIAEFALESAERFGDIEDFCGLVHCCAGVDVQ